MGSRISYRDVLRHRANGRSIREIAAACHCSSTAVQDALERADERGAGWDDVTPPADDEVAVLSIAHHETLAGWDSGTCIMT